MPGLKVIAPYSAADAKGLLKRAIRDPNPIIFLENEILYGQTFEVPQLDDFVCPIGKARVARTGKDVTIDLVVDRHDLRAQGGGRTREGRHRRRGHRPAHDPPDGHRDDRPLGDEDRPLRHDRGGLSAIRRRRRNRRAHHGEAFDYLDAPVLRVTGKDVPMPYAANLEKLALPNVGEVVAAAKAVLYR